MTFALEMTNAGFKCSGSWRAICGFSRDLEDIMKRCVSNGDSINKYNDWRPREDEIDEDMKKKTAEGAAIKTTNMERNFNNTKEELKKAGDRFKSSFENMKNGINPTTNLKDASKHVGKLVGIKSVRSIRKMEQIIYEKIMLNFNSYYFDTVDFSANLEGDGDSYVLTINIPDEKRRRRVKKAVRKEDV